MSREGDEQIRRRSDNQTLHEELLRLRRHPIVEQANQSLLANKARGDFRACLGALEALVDGIGRERPLAWLTRLNLTRALIETLLLYGDEAPPEVVAMAQGAREDQLLCARNASNLSGPGRGMAQHQLASLLTESGGDAEALDAWLVVLGGETIQSLDGALGALHHAERLARKLERNDLATRARSLFERHRSVFEAEGDHPADEDDD